MIIAMGRRPPAWFTEAFDDYARRLPKHLNLEFKLLPVPKGRRDTSADIARMAELEGDRLLAAAGDAHVIALERRGRAITSDSLAATMNDWLMGGKNVAFLIGGADGLAPNALANADEVWSLSKLVFAHRLVPVILAEQLYRAFSITEGAPYHRGESVASRQSAGPKTR